MASAQLARFATGLHGPGITSSSAALALNGSGVATFSYSNTFAAGTTILSASFNTNFTEVRNFVINSGGNYLVHIDGAQTITGAKTHSAQIISTLATGTAPFSIISTTVVSNLNVDRVDGEDFDDLIFAAEVLT